MKCHSRVKKTPEEIRKTTSEWVTMKATSGSLCREIWFSSQGERNKGKVIKSRHSVDENSQLDVDPRRDDDASPMSSYRCLLRPT